MNNLLLSTAACRHGIAAKTSRWSIWLAGAAFAVLWLDLIRQLSYEWNSNEQYSYGWFVPILAGGLLLRSWPSRPAPRPVGVRPAVSLVVILAALLFLPLRVVHEINQDWPLISWLLALCVVAFSLYAIFRLGGMPWFRYFAFPVCFILLAVQWPYRLEHSLTQGLMRLVASIDVELLSWINIPAIQHGNLIELANGTVGVDEACSGIRSFQSTLMGSLFLGELYLLRISSRCVLVVAGVAVALLLNVVRTFVLSYQAANIGFDALERWHDPAGIVITLSSFFCLWVVALWINRRGSRAAVGIRPAGSERAGGDTNSAGQNAGRADDDALPLQPSSWFAGAFTSWVAFVMVGTQLWYRSSAVDEASATRWTVALPESLESFKRIELPKKTLDLLRADERLTGAWRIQDGGAWTVYFLRWSAHSMQSVIRARAHKPEVCLSASGLQCVSGPTLQYFDVGSLRLPFHKYTFDSSRGPLFVFFLLWEDGQESQKGMRKLTARDRIEWALNGRRHMAQQTLEIICSEYASAEDAEAAVRTRLKELIKIGNPGQEGSNR